MRDNLKALVSAVDTSTYHKHPHRIIGLPGIALCRGPTNEFKKYTYLFLLKASLRRGDGTTETVKAQVFRERISMEKVPNYLKLLVEKVTAADYSKTAQEIEDGSDDVMFCTAQPKVLPGYREIFSLETKTGKLAYVFIKKDPSEII